MGLGDWISGILGSKNKYRADTTHVNPNAYELGGRAGFADETAQRYRNTAEGAQTRQGPQINYGEANAAAAQGQQARGQAAQARGMSMESRGNQGLLASRMTARATGAEPSIASMQAQRDMATAQAAQAAQAASARGAAGIALAQQNAANNTANAQGSISGQAQINAANERMQAEQAAFGAYGNMRQGDLATQQGDFAMRQGDQQSEQLAGQRAQYGAGLDMQQRQLNDQMTQSMTQNEMATRNAQMTGQMNRWAQQSGNNLAVQGINSGVAGQNANMNQANGMALIGGIQKGAGAVAGALADGGPAHGGKPYLVGERGPEVVVPKQDSVVIPNHQLPIVAKSTWGTGPGLTQYDWDERARKIEYQHARDEEAARNAPLSTAMAVPGFSPGIKASATEPMDRRDEETLAYAQAKQAEGDELTDEEARKVRAAGYRQGKAKKTDAANAAKEREAPKQGPLATAMGSSGDEFIRAGSRVDTSYHGPGAHAPPQLIAIGSRAMGGPVDGGAPYLMGEQGPEAVVPAAGLASAMAPSPKGGYLAGPVANLQAFMSPSNHIGAKPGKGFMAPGRADGGPVEAGQPYTMGERGPEAVLPLYEPPGQQLHQSADGHAYLAVYPDANDDGGRATLTSRLSPPKVPASADVGSGEKPKRKLTLAEIIEAATRMEREQRSDHEARMAQGPAVRGR